MPLRYDSHRTGRATAISRAPATMIGAEAATVDQMPARGAAVASASFDQRVAGLAAARRPRTRPRPTVKRRPTSASRSMPRREHRRGARPRRESSMPRVLDAAPSSALGAAISVTALARARHVADQWYVALEAVRRLGRARHRRPERAARGSLGWRSAILRRRCLPCSRSQGTGAGERRPRCARRRPRRARRTARAGSGRSTSASACHCTPSRNGARAASSIALDRRRRGARARGRAGPSAERRPTAWWWKELTCRRAPAPTQPAQRAEPGRDPRPRASAWRSPSSRLAVAVDVLVQRAAAGDVRAPAAPRQMPEQRQPARVGGARERRARQRVERRLGRARARSWRSAAP